MIEAKQVRDERGSLTVWSLPFMAQRVFLVSNTEQVQVHRGGHAHRRAHQMFVRIAEPKIWFQVTDQNLGVSLLTPDVGGWVYLPPLTWVDIAMEPGATFVMVASEAYREDEYIRDFEQFRSVVRAHAMRPDDPLWESALSMLESGVQSAKVVQCFDETENAVPRRRFTRAHLERAARLLR